MKVEDLPAPEQYELRFNFNESLRYSIYSVSQ